MSSSWQYRIGTGELQSGRDAGVLFSSIDYASRAPDTAVLVTLPEIVIPYRTSVEIWHGDVRRFLGVCMPGKRTAARSTLAVEYRLAGPWWHLQRIVYRQIWQTLVRDALGPTPSGRVILHQSAAGAAISVDAQLADIIAYARTQSAPLALGACATHLTLPWDEQRDLTCAQAVDRCLRFCPDVCSRIDYAPAVPVLHFTAGDDFQIPDSAETIVDQARDDLVCPGVEIQIERLGQHDGTQYRTLQNLTAGDVADPDAVHATLQLAGPESNRTVLRVDVVTETIPAPLANAAWWIARHPRLNGIAAGDLSIIDTGRWTLDTAANPPAWAVAADTNLYPRISLTPIAQLVTLDVRSRVERITATCDIIRRNAANEIIDNEHAVVLELQVVTTNATTRTYTHVQAFSGIDGEPVPEGLAAELLAHWSTRYYDGTATWPLADAWPVVGAIVSGSPIQSCSVESSRNTASVQFGAPAHLSIEDFAARLQGFRTRRASISWRSRSTGEPAPSAELDPAQLNPAKVPGQGGGEKRQLVVAGATTGKIDLNPSGLSESQSMSPRTLLGSDKFLSTAALPTATVDVPVSWELTSSNGLRYKTKTLTVLAVGDLSSTWTTLATFDPHSGEHGA